MTTRHSRSGNSPGSRQALSQGDYISASAEEYMVRKARKADTIPMSPARGPWRRALYIRRYSIPFGLHFALPDLRAFALSYSNSGHRSICSMNDSRPSTPAPPSSSQGRNLQVHAPHGATTSVDASSRSSTIVDQGEPTEGDGEDVNSTFAREAYGPPDGEKPQDPFEVTIGPDDPQNPKTWSRPYRWYLTMLAAVLLLNAYVVS